MNCQLEELTTEITECAEDDEKNLLVNVPNALQFGGR
jgi:hypothetical protein